MNFKLETEFSKADILNEVDALKKQIDDLRPLPADVEGRVMQKLRLDWNYHSNAIEGNRLSYGETVAFLMEGITAKGKPLKDHLDIRGHNEAINFLLSIVKDTRSISEADIRSLHEMVLVEPYDVKAQTADGLPTTKRITLGDYKTSPNHVQTATGETHYYATPEETPAKMQELMEWYAEISTDKDVHPVVIAALFHHKFVSIHPFDDGNGRLSRILMNLILMQRGFPPVIIKINDRQNYYALLSQADRGDNWPFIEYIVESVIGSLQLFLKAANGGDIDEDEDIDKEIALFKMQIKEDIKTKEKKSKRTINKILQDVIGPLSNDIFKITNKFSDLFFNHDHYLKVNDKKHETTNDDFFDEIDGPLIDRINTTIESFDGLDLIVTFKKFKNPDNDFDINLRLKIIFTEYHYQIVDNHEVTFISKLYHENISKEEGKIVVKSVTESLKNMIQIKLKQQSPKS
jgi:Fic family protein